MGRDWLLLVAGGSTPTGATLTFSEVADAQASVSLLPQLAFSEVSESSGNVTFSVLLGFTSTGQAVGQITEFGQVTNLVFASKAPAPDSLSLLPQLTFGSAAPVADSVRLARLLSGVSVAEESAVVKLLGQFSFASSAESAGMISVSKVPLLSFQSVAPAPDNVSFARLLAFKSVAQAPSSAAFTPFVPPPSLLTTLKVNQPPRSVSPWMTNAIWANIVSESDRLQGMVKATATEVNGSGVPLGWTVSQDASGFLVANPNTGAKQFFYPSLAGYYRVVVRAVSTGSASGNLATLTQVVNGVATVMASNYAGGANQTLSFEDVIYFDGISTRAWWALASSGAVAFDTTLLVQGVTLGGQG